MVWLDVHVRVQVQWVYGLVWLDVHVHVHVHVIGHLAPYCLCILETLEAPSTRAKEA